MMALQLADSPLATTRIFWRRKFGLAEEVATDPRPMREIDENWPDWKNGKATQEGYEFFRALRLHRDHCRKIREA